LGRRCRCGGGTLGHRWLGGSCRRDADAGRDAGGLGGRDAGGPAGREADALAGSEAGDRAAAAAAASGHGACRADDRRREERPLNSQAPHADPSAQPESQPSQDVPHDWCRQNYGASPARREARGGLRPAARISTLNARTHAGNSNSTQTVIPTATKSTSAATSPATVSHLDTISVRRAMVTVVSVNTAAIRIA